MKRLLKHDAAPTRHVVLAAVTLLVLGGIGAVRAGLAGRDFMFDLEQVTPALARAKPSLPDPQTPRLARRVFVVIVDGLRLDKSYELPFLDELRRRGVDSEAQSHYPSWSRPNYVSILAGVPPSASGVRTNHHSTPVALDSLMDRVRAAGLHAAMATDYDVLPRLFLRPRAPRITDVVAPMLTGTTKEAKVETSDVETNDVDDTDAVDDEETVAAVRAPDANLESPFDDARYAPWPGGFSESGDALAAGHAELVVMLLGAVDAAGHAHGGASEEYRDASLIADHALARALARIDLTQDAVIITADHGHTDRGGHGGIEPEVMTVPLIAAGAGIKKGSTAVDAHLIDIAPTVATLLGIAAPGHGLGRTLVEILAVDGATSTARQIADLQRIATNRAVVARAESNAAVDVLENRALRISFVVGGGVMALLLALLLVRRRAVIFDARLLLVSVPAFFVAYYAIIGAVGSFSPSLLPAQGHLAATMAKYGLAAMVIQLAFNLWGLRRQQTLAERLARANGIAWMGLMLAMIPAGLAWAFFPPPYISVPPPMWLVLIPAVEVAVACAAVDVALTLMVEVIIFVARAYYRR
ncbi:MAG: hypothetical protein HOV81_17460 [Kofleriaceae bacterium]|nr:hypothetical protein [Kofleriaceae bacterium]